MVDDKTAARRIRATRHSLGLTQAEFCALLGSREGVHLTQTLLSRYERGVIMPPADKFLAILRLAGEPEPDKGL